VSGRHAGVARRLTAFSSNQPGPQGPPEPGVELYRGRRWPYWTVVPLVDVAALAVCWWFFLGQGLVGGAYAAVAAAALAGFGVRGRIQPRVSDDLGGVLGRLGVPLILLAPWLAAEGGVSLLRGVFIAAAAVVGGRILTYRTLHLVRANGLLKEPTVIVGAGSHGVLLAETLREHPEFGLIPIGFIDRVDDSNLPFPLLGDASDLEAVIERFGVRRLIVAFGLVRDPVMVRVLRTCQAADVRIHVMPRFFDLGIAHGDRRVDDVWGIPLVPVRRAALQPGAMLLKRSLDILLAGTALLLTLPLIGLIALVVKLTSRGPVLFRQKRVGRNGQIVEILKFRSMRVNAESDTRWSVDQSDADVTRLGAFLRRTSLDELPQLVNVLRGDMSLVGPRPERPFFVDQFSMSIADYGDRHRLAGGVTGWSQIHGLRGDSSIEARARFDNQYIENWSLWRDIVILFRTIAAVAKDALS
jgi:exopolysaccharide biosynthesis polyprenyl glycosylphosphotransferase